MKTTIASREQGNFSLLDLLIMIVAAGAVVASGYIYMESQRTGAKAQQINCVNNLKCVGLAYRLWGGDNGDKYPGQVSTNAGGTMELVANGFAFPDFIVMSNELSTPKIVVCPNDKARSFAAGFGSLTNDANVSYFTSPAADETIPDMWLSGDRNIATNTVVVGPGLISFPTNRVMSWTSGIHNHKGNLAMADGSVQQLADAGLQRSVTNAIRAYRMATTNAPEPRLIIP